MLLFNPDAFFYVPLQLPSIPKDHLHFLHQQVWMEEDIQSPHPPKRRSVVVSSNFYPPIDDRLYWSHAPLRIDPKRYLSQTVLCLFSHQMWPVALLPRQYKHL